MNIRVIKSARRTISLEVSPECEVILRAPYLATRREIEQFLDSKTDWINRTVRRMEKAREEEEQAVACGRRPFTEQEIRELANRAMEVIPPKVRHYADIIGVSYGRITIRNQKTRWGSCSVRHNLNFNCFLMNAPEDILDYVIVHELCHIIEMNHSQAFWAEVGKVLPDYRDRRKWLKDNGNKLIYRYDEANR